MQQTGAAPLATLDAVLERITYANEETGYTVARVATDRSGDLLTVVGALLGAQPGESLRLRGRWASHPQYGRQFQVEAYDTMLPATIQGIRRYLGSGLIKGIGPKMAERIVDHFGPATLEVIEQQPTRLVEVAGLGPKRTGMITAAWAEQQAIKEVMVFLQGVGVSTSLGVRIYKTYRDEAIEVVRREPYRLAGEVWGIGFKTADQLARSLGIPHDSPQRVKAGLQFALSQASEDGHCYLPEAELVAKATELLGVDTELARRCLEELVAEEGVVAEPLPAQLSPDGPERTGRAIWLVPFHRAEVALAAGLVRLLDAPVDRLASFQTVDWTVALDWLQQTFGVTLAAEQVAAVRLALTQPVAVLTGGPGCGKSYSVRAIVALARAKGAKVVLAAPTGRAAKRLSELAGLQAATLHRLLQLRPGGEAAFDRDHPLDADLVVVDETSMLDVLLANKLVKAVPPGAHLLVVGDVDQLPSVGAGEVLRDLLAAERLPRVRLTKVFRQAQHSGVVTNAHRINAGQPPVTWGLADFFLFPEEESDQVADLVVDIVANRLPRRFGLDPTREVQVLCPMHRGPAGAGRVERAAPGGADPSARRACRAPLRRPCLPGRRQGHAGPQQLRQGHRRGVQRLGRAGHRAVVGGQRAAGPVGRGRGGRLRVRRAGRADPRLCGQHPPRPRQRVPLCGRAPHDECLDDAATQPALHRGDPSQRHRGPGRQPTRPGQGGPDPGRRPSLHRPHRTAPARTDGSGLPPQPAESGDTQRLPATP